MKVSRLSIVFLFLLLFYSSLRGADTYYQPYSPPETPFPASSLRLSTAFGSIEDGDETDPFPDPGTGIDEDGSINDPVPVNDGYIVICGLIFSYIVFNYYRKERFLNKSNKNNSN